MKMLSEEHRRIKDIKDTLKQSGRRDEFENHVEPAVTIESKINSPEKKTDAPFFPPNEPASALPDPISPESPFAKIPPLLRQMPKRTFLGLLISGFFNIIFICKETLATKRPEIAGYYKQVDNKKTDEQNPETPGDPLGTPVYKSEHGNILAYAIKTTLHVFYNPEVNKLYAIETTFLKYYYVSDSEGSKEKYFVGSSKAEYRHEETGTQGGKIQMKGYRIEDGSCPLKGELLFGDRESTRKIKELIDAEAGIIQSKFPESKTEWYLDENDLIKQERYQKNPTYRKELERFVRIL